MCRASEALQIPADRLLANDRDADANDVLGVASVVAASQLGAAVRIVGNRVVYDPRGGGTRRAARRTAQTDSFVYTITDGQSTSSATVFVSVLSPQNQPPQPTADAIAITEEGVHEPASLLANDADPDALPADRPLQAVAQRVTSARGADVTIAADGTFQYDAAAAAGVQALAPGETLQDSFTYQVLDARGGTASGTATLSVRGENDVPKAIADSYLGVDPSVGLTVSALTGPLANDVEVDSTDGLVLDVSRSDATSGIGIPIQWGADGSFQYDPGDALAYLPAGQTLTDTFAYTVVDGYGGEARGTVTLQLVGRNNAPARRRCAPRLLDGRRARAAGLGRQRPAGKRCGSRPVRDRAAGHQCAGRPIATGRGDHNHSGRGVCLRPEPVQCDRRRDCSRPGCVGLVPVHADRSARAD